MQEKSGAQISRKAFIQSAVILLVLMIVAGILTRIIPTGEYQRIDLDGRESIVADSYAITERPDYPIWRWFTAPLEVLAGPDSLTIIVIIVFILMVGVAFAIMDKSGILKAALARIVRRFGGQKYTLLLVICFFFMTLGAFFGIFEEVVPLVPLMIALAYSLGWDTLTGLGMSILATNMGFSAAIANPFTIGVAQGLAELPAFSGAWYRIIIFLFMYILLAVFLTRHARKVEANPQASPVHSEEQATREKYSNFSADAIAQENKGTTPAITFLLVCVLLIFADAHRGTIHPRHQRLRTADRRAAVPGRRHRLQPDRGHRQECMEGGSGWTGRHRTRHPVDPDGSQRETYHRLGRHPGHDPEQRGERLCGRQSDHRRLPDLCTDIGHRVLCLKRFGKSLPADAAAHPAGGTGRHHAADRGTGISLRRWLLEPGVSHQRGPVDLPEPDRGHLPQMAEVGAGVVGLGHPGVAGIHCHRGMDELRTLLNGNHPCIV